MSDTPAEVPAPDIVERLRGPIAKAVQKLVNGCFRNANGPTFHIPAQETDPDLLASKGVQEAADEIERLTADVERLKTEMEDCKRWAAQVTVEANEEVSRLRVALRQIAGIDPWDSGEQGYVDKARAALTQEPRT